MWISDGSAFESEDGRIKCLATPKGDSKFNFLYHDGEGAAEGSGSHYWEIRIADGDGVWNDGSIA